MTFRTIVLTVAALAAATQLAIAESPKERVADLQVAKQKLVLQSQQTKGAPRQLMQMEARKIAGLIDDLKHGRPVDPADIDRALKRAERGGW